MRLQLPLIPAALAAQVSISAVVCRLREIGLHIFLTGNEGAGKLVEAGLVRRC